MHTQTYMFGCVCVYVYVFIIKYRWYYLRYKTMYVGKKLNKKDRVYVFVNMIL